MKISGHHTRYSDLLIVILLLLVSAWVLFYRLGDPNFYHVRLESRRVQTAQAMIETGDWLVPRLCGNPMLTKPPLYYWAVALCTPGQRVSELTARIPSAVGGLGTLFFTFLIARLLFDKKSAVLSVVALLVTNIFIYEARYAEMESLLIFFITAAVYCFLKAYKNRSREGRWVVCAFAMMGFGTITKGPFAFTFPLIPLAAYLFLYKEAGFMIRRPFLYGLALFSVIVLPWVVYILNRFPGFFHLLFWETILYYSAGYEHSKPFYFYIAKTYKVFFPWIFFLPAALWIAFRKQGEKLCREYVFILLWIFGNMLFLSFSSAKREYYLAPLAPAVAILTGAAWHAFWDRFSEKLKHKSSTTVQSIFFYAGAVLAIASFFTGDPFEINFPGDHFPHLPCFLLFTGLCFMLVAGLNKYCRHLRPGTACFFSISGIVLLFHFLYLTYSVPVINVEGSAKSFYRYVGSVLSHGEPLGYYGSYENYALRFYSRRDITYFTRRQIEDAKRFMSLPEKRYIIMTSGNFEKKYSDMPWKIMLESRYAERRSWKQYLLLCNR